MGDKERLDWIENAHTLHKGIEIWYVVDGYQIRSTYDGEIVGTEYAEGKDLREAIDQAIKSKTIT